MRALLALTIAVAACGGPVPPPEPGFLRGTVTGTSLGPLAGVTVAITPNNGGSGAILGDTTTTATNGEYEFSEVPTGVGTIVVSGYPNTCQQPVAGNFTITANDTTVTNISLTCP